MDDFLILLQAKLDEAKSKGNVNADIKELQNQLDKLKIQVELDPKTVQKLADSIEKLINQKITISNIGIDTNNTIKIAQRTGQQIGNAINQGVTNAVSKANNTLKSFSDLRSFSELNKSINNFHVDTSELKNYKSILDEVKNTYAEFGQVRITNEIFKDGVLEKFKVNIEQVNGDLKETKSFMMSLNDEKDAFVFSGLISGSERVVQHLDKTKDAVNQTAEAINALKEKAQIDKIQLSMDNGHGASEYQNRINSIIASLEKYGVETKEAQAITTSLQSTFDSMKGMSGQELITQADKLEKEFQSVKISVEQAKLSYDKFTRPVSDEKISSLIIKINNFLKQNTAITKESKVQLENYVKELSGGNISLERWTSINNQLISIKASMSILDKFGKSLKDQFSQAAGTLTQYFSIARGFSLVFDQLQKIPKAVYEIDTAMTNLYKVTDETEKKYISFLDSASYSAYNLGRSVSSLVDQTANWAKLGFSLDEASRLSEISSIYANVGEVDDDTAVKDIVTAIKAFNIEAENSITIVDSLNKLGNEFATDAKSLGEGLRNAASSMAVAGNDINQTLAILTGGGEITQNVGELANGLRVVSMRLRGMKGELQELGEEYEDIESISKIQTQIYNLSKGTVNIFKDDGSFKSTYDQLKEISEIYFDLSDSDRADLTEIMFGKNRANQGVAILQAFKSGQIEKAYEASANAAGSAMQEQERWMGSLEAKTQQFEASFQSLSSTILDSNLLKWFVDFGTGTTKTLDTIINKLGSLGTIGLGAGLFAGVKNTGKCRMSVRIS